MRHINIITRTKPIMIVFYILEISSLGHYETRHKFIFFKLFLTPDLFSTISFFLIQRCSRGCIHTWVWILNYFRKLISLLLINSVSSSHLLFALTDVSMRLRGRILLFFCCFYLILFKSNGSIELRTEGSIYLFYIFSTSLVISTWIHL